MTRLGLMHPSPSTHDMGAGKERGLTSTWKGVGPDVSHTRA